jgi:hypothetical protein
MTGELLLVGSVPLDTVEQVFRTVGGPLGPYLAYMPDGEVGDRRYWIDGIAYRVLNGHPVIETLRRPAPDENGVERWRPQGIHDQFRFRVKPGVREVVSVLMKIEVIAGHRAGSVEQLRHHPAACRHDRGRQRSRRVHRIHRPSCYAGEARHDPGASSKATSAAAEPKVRRLTAGGKRIRTDGPI